MLSARNLHRGWVTSSRAHCVLIKIITQTPKPENRTYSIWILQFAGFLRIASKHVYSTHLRSVFSKEVTDNNTNINQMKITLWFFTCGLHPTDQEAVPAHQLDEQPSPHRWWYIPAWHLCVMFLVFTWHWHRSDRYHHRHDLIATSKTCQHISFFILIH